MKPDYAELERLDAELRAYEREVLYVRAAAERNDRWSLSHPDRIRKQIADLQRLLADALNPAAP